MRVNLFLLVCISICLSVWCPHAVFSREGSDGAGQALLRKQANDYFLGEQYRFAIDTLKELHRVAPGDFESLYLLGSSYYHLGSYREAATCYEQVIAQSPSYVIAYLGLGSSYNKLGQYQNACAVYEKVIALDERNVYAHHGYAAALFNARRWAQARSEYVRAKGLYAQAGDGAASGELEGFIRDIDGRGDPAQGPGRARAFVYQRQKERFVHLLPFRGYDFFVYGFLSAAAAVFVWLYGTKKRIALTEKGIAGMLIASGLSYAFAGVFLLCSVRHVLPSFVRLGLALGGLFFIYLGVSFLQQCSWPRTLIMWSQGIVVIFGVFVLLVLPRRILDNPFVFTYLVSHLVVTVIMFALIYFGIMRLRLKEEGDFLLR
ncbi:MAG: tetratricopeptide repeat protein [Candidatus Omnitrophota bacterium]|nr:tetratricopeptide repeat protein [Candidatus Omnitrophota bacterium]